MSSKRPPAPPPHIRGFKYVSLLGSGGFSDVYLYEQDRPRRKVAVKVLLSGLKTEGARRRFESEANLMAQLSSHPYIVTIYEAEVTEDGHSYLAMEYCSRPSLDVRYRRQRFSVDEVLAIGIQVSSAVETAHRAGIAHRDIKPANILVTDYNRPALTDFGISGTIGDDSDDEAGMSIPWSPPEQFRGGPVDGVLVDVWALGATLYTLLAGRSPFVMPGQDNSQRELISRITNSPLPRLGRADVPESLELALSTAMAKTPESRYSSAHAFALALQRIQAELNLSVTPFEVLEEPSHGDERHPDDGVEETRVRSIAAIDPDAGAGATGRGVGTVLRGWTPDGSSTEAPAPSTEAQASPADVTSGEDDATRLRSAQAAGGTTAGVPLAATAGHATAPVADVTSAPKPAEKTEQPKAQLFATRSRGPELDQTVSRPTPDQDEEQAEPRDHRKRQIVLAAVGAAVLVVAVVVGIVLGVGAPPKAKPTQTVSKPPADALDSGNVPEVVFIANYSVSPTKVQFTWSNPDEKPGDTYKWRVKTARDAGTYTSTPLKQVDVSENPSEPTCIQVIIVRADGTASPGGEASISCKPK
ncbi:serine/threonine-protein kinase [Arthrobacter sp. M4]|uniref:serine/threonine-protein kinase n=1 Tax=Arthrobacter sp. M4 TaxID=218160 RepID=UPI001CDB7866|nr:serine/threonine-protein kinase [Arthrobacter sp. M4]MCA4133670.1 protein kinase [Arthrobacter sp. M4]